MDVLYHIKPYFGVYIPLPIEQVPNDQMVLDYSTWL